MRRGPDPQSHDPAASLQAAAASAGPAGLVRRCVFYIPGYDPFPPRRYRELYRREAAAQARISGHQIRLKALPGAPEGGPAGGQAGGQAGAAWQISAQIEGAATLCRYQVLPWSDIVQDSMGGASGWGARLGGFAGLFAGYRQLGQVVWAYLGSGVLWRLLRLRKGPMIAALYPVAALIGAAVLALGLGFLAARLLLAAGLPGGLAWGAGLALALAGLWLFHRLDRHHFAFYLMHDYAFGAVAGGAMPAPLAPRLDAWRAKIRAALAQDWDEILLIGHSSGAHLAVSCLADLRRDLLAEGLRPDPRLALLTLGQVVPMIAFLPRADQLRADLQELAEQPDWAWIDISAPGDGCAFALCDPVAVSGLARPGRLWPRVLSAAFRQTLSPARFQALRWRFFRLHFQYLCAFDRPGAYDFFAITAGPQSLRARLAGRPASPSRIEAARNPHSQIGPGVRRAPMAHPGARRAPMVQTGAQNPSAGAP